MRFSENRGDGPLTLSILAWQEIFGGGYFYGLNTKCVCRNWTRAIYCRFAHDVTEAMLVKGKETLVHLKRWTNFFETFPVGPNRSIEFWNSGISA